MGVSSWENWIAWFIKDLIFLFFCCLIMTAMLCIRFNGPAVLNQSDPGLVLLWLILYGINIIVFTFFITTFFDKGNVIFFHSTTYCFNICINMFAVIFACFNICINLYLSVNNFKELLFFIYLKFKIEDAENK